jgi:transposase
MGRALSRDLRKRVGGAVEGGPSCRAAAKQSGVSAANAIRWRQPVLRHGTPAAKPQGGDRRSAKIEDHAGRMRAAMARRHGRCRRSERLRASVPHGHR